MLTTRRLFLSALALTAGSALAIGLPSAATAAPTVTQVPQFIIQFSAIALPVTPTGLQFHSTSCAIGPSTNPIVVTCKETATIRFTNTGGSGTATVSSVLAGIHWKFTLVKANPITNVFRMVGKGTESIGASPVLRPVRVTGTVTLEPTPLPTIKGSEDVYPLPAPAA